MAVGVDEDAGVAAVEGVGGLTPDGGAGRARLFDHLVHLVVGAGVVGEGDPAPAAVVGDRAVVGELVAAPQRNDHPARPEEDHVVIGFGAGGPAESLVEGARPGQIRDPERDQAYTLLHGSTT